MGAPVLCNAADDKVYDSLRQVLPTVLVDSTAVRPKPDKLKHAKEDADDINPGLHVMFSLNDAQKFQAIKGEGVKKTSPDPADCIAVGGVGDTVVVPAADVAMRVFSESMLGVPPVDPRPEQTHQDPGGTYEATIRKFRIQPLPLSLFSLPLQL